MHAKASIDGVVIAETDHYETVEGNVYFPPSAIESYKDAYTKTSHSTHCSWKGDASYYTISVNGKELRDSAWFYATPLPKAENIKDHVAFYKYTIKIESS